MTGVHEERRGEGGDQSKERKERRKKERKKIRQCANHSLGHTEKLSSETTAAWRSQAVCDQKERKEKVDKTQRYGTYNNEVMAAAQV